MKLPTATRLTFARLGRVDAAFILELLNEPGFLRFIGDRGVRSPEDAWRYIRDGPVASYARDGFGLLRLTLTATGEPVGMCGLLQRDTLPHPDLGFAVLARHGGRGYASEAGRAVIDCARRDLHLDRLLAITNPDNDASISVLRRLGFVGGAIVELAGIGHPVRLFTLDSSPTEP